MSLKIKFAKTLMQIIPSKPEYGRKHFQQEYLNHPEFLALTEEKRKDKLLEFAHNHYLEDKHKPFDLFFPGYNLKNLLNKKIVLDIGCSLGGTSISCAERWKVGSMYGIDANDELIEAANLYISKSNDYQTKFVFKFDYAENLPFEDSYFDAIITTDTIEHVVSVEKTLTECKRVLKKGGIIFCVFPSYYFPFGGAHLGSVTKMPFLEWFFDADTLNRAYQELIKNLPDEYKWFTHNSKSKNENWAKVKAGIGINGITYHKFKKIVNEIGFEKITFIKIPLLNVSNAALRYPIIKLASNFLKPLLKIEKLIDSLSHRLVFIMIK